MVFGHTRLVKTGYTFAAHVWWQLFVDEFKLFLCTDDKKYAALRKQLYGTKNQTAAVTMISAGIGTYIGVASVAVAPIAVLGVTLVLKMGAEAFCRMQNIDNYRPFGE